jgi:eukaryotic-like serine/threonine-protein kinase
MSEDLIVGGRYALGELLGVGGSASVFAAVDTRTGGRVAVKLLHPHLCEDDATRAAFLAEAERASLLRDPHIVRVHAAGLHEAGGVVMPWIALDLAEGETLRERVRRAGPLSTDDAVTVARGVLAGLAAAHAAGVVHRDISPQNVVVGTGDGPDADHPSPDAVRILDFGLADVTGRTTRGGDLLLAQDGDRVIGNAAYMSPEQAQGRPVRAASDLYQVGALLYFALTGTPPFVRPTTEQTLEAHVAAPPPVPSALVPSARRLDRIVTRAMSKTPARRFRDAAEFDAELAAAAPAVAVAAASGDAVAEPGTAATRLLPEQRTGSLDYLSPVPGAAEPAVRTRSSGGIAAAATAVAVVVGLGIWAGMSAAGGTAAPSPSATAIVAEPPPPESPTPTPSRSAPAVAAPEPTTATVAAPALFGTVADAERALAAVGLVVGAINRVDSPESADRVLGQSPVAGAELAPGASVDLTLASGYNAVPYVAGLDAATAAAMVQSAGFVLASPPADGTAGVLGTMPGSGAVVRVGVTVALRLAPAPTSTETPAPTATAPARGAP